MIEENRSHVARLKRVLERFVEVKIIEGRGWEEEGVVLSEVVLRRGGK